LTVNLGCRVLPIYQVFPTIQQQQQQQQSIFSIVNNDQRQNNFSIINTNVTPKVTIPRNVTNTNIASTPSTNSRSQSDSKSTNQVLQIKPKNVVASVVAEVPKKTVMRKDTGNDAKISLRIGGFGGGGDFGDRLISLKNLGNFDPVDTPEVKIETKKAETECVVITQDPEDEIVVKAEKVSTKKAVVETPKEIVKMEVDKPDESTQMLSPKPVALRPRADSSANKTPLELIRSRTSSFGIIMSPVPMRRRKRSD
jgi:hypothetical protein